MGREKKGSCGPQHKKSPNIDIWNLQNSENRDASLGHSSAERREVMQSDPVFMLTQPLTSCVAKSL